MMSRFYMRSQKPIFVAPARQVDPGAAVIYKEREMRWEKIHDMVWYAIRLCLIWRYGGFIYILRTLMQPRKYIKYRLSCCIGILVIIESPFWYMPFLLKCTCGVQFRASVQVESSFYFQGNLTSVKTVIIKRMVKFVLILTIISKWNLSSRP